MASALLVELGVAERVVAVDAASAALPALRGRPVLGEEPGALRPALDALGAGLVVLPEERADLAASLRAGGREVVVAAAHDFDEGFALWRELGALVGLGPLMHDLVRERTRPLAQLAAASYGARRPRVAAIVSLDPLAIAGGHDFVAALVEHAGAENVTHGRPESRLDVDGLALRALAPERLVFVARGPIAPDERAAAAAVAAGVAPLCVVEFDRDRFFGEGTLDAVRSIRECVAAPARPGSGGP